MNVVMAVLIRGLWTFAAVVLTAAVLVIGGGAALTTNQPTVPTLYFMYAMNCTFTIQNDAGADGKSDPAGHLSGGHQDAARVRHGARSPGSPI